MRTGTRADMPCARRCGGSPAKPRCRFLRRALQILVGRAPRSKARRGTQALCYSRNWTPSRRHSILARMRQLPFTHVRCAIVLLRGCLACSWHVRECQSYAVLRGYALVGLLLCELHTCLCTCFPLPHTPTTHLPPPPGRYSHVGMLLPELRPLLSPLAHALPDKPFAALLQVRQCAALCVGKSTKTHSLRHGCSRAGGTAKPHPLTGCPA